MSAGEAEKSAAEGSAENFACAVRNATIASPVTAKSAPPADPHTRAAPRVPAGDLDVAVRLPPATAWQTTKLEELSATGARLAHALAVVPGSPIEIELRPVGEAPFVLAGELVRRPPGVPGGPVVVAVRWLTLSDDERARLAKEIDRRVGGLGAEQVQTDTGMLAVSAAQLQASSIYAHLKIATDADADALEARFIDAMAAISLAEGKATGERKTRLTAAHAELGKLNRLLADAERRAAYDFRFGLARADARIAEAQRGRGPSMEVLRRVWKELFPQRVARADDLIASASQLEGAARTKALDEALVLDPFRSDARMQRAQTSSNVERGVRGSLSEMGLAEIVQTLEIGGRPAEVELWQGDQAVGVIGFADNHVVLAATGEVRDLECFHALVALKEGNFVIIYRAPRAELRHLHASATGLLLDAMRRLDEGRPASVPLAELSDELRLTTGPFDDGDRARAAEEALLEADLARREAEAKAKAVLANVQGSADGVRRQLLASEQARIDAERAAERAAADRAELERELARVKQQPAGTDRAAVEVELEEARRSAANLVEAQWHAAEVERIQTQRLSPQPSSSSALSLVLVALLGVSVGLGGLSIVHSAGAQERNQAERFAQARSLVAANRIDEATVLLTTLALERPDAAIVARQLGDAWARAGDRARAAAEYERYLQLSPDADDAPAVRLALGR